MTTLTLGVLQMACSPDREENLATADRLVRDAADRGAQVVLLPELFEGPYFPKDQDPAHFARALPLDGHPTVERFRKVASELGVVLPVSVFERAGQAFFNTVAMVDADGEVLGHYRKSHIPDGPGYTEKFYFSPGDTGFRVWRTRFGEIGLAICWDQWFPEAARALALAGADVILYPTAIGSEPTDPGFDSSGPWQRVMQGHAAANVVPVAAANRVGPEQGATWAVDFYGSSFIADEGGALLAEAGRDAEEVLVARVDLEAVRAQRAAWGLFRDRRPDLYGSLLGFGGESAPKR